MTNLREHIQGFYEDIIARGRMLINSVSCNYLHVNPTDSGNVAAALGRNVRVCQAKTSIGWRAIDASAMAENWMVTPEIEKRTLSCTTLRGIRLTAHLSMSRLFLTNDRHMRFKRLCHNMYTNTMKSSVPSRSKDLYSQVFVTGFRWVREFQ